MPAARRLGVALLLAVVAVSSLAGFFTLLRAGGGAGGGEAVTTPAAAAPCPENSVVIVVPRGYSSEERAKFSSTVRVALAKYAEGYGFCEVTEDALPFRLPAYPALLVRGEAPPGLRQLVAGSVDGYQVLDYTLAATVALSLNLPLKMTARAEALVVAGETEWGRPGKELTSQKVIDALEALAVARITGVRVVEEPPAGADALKSYPAVVLRSDADLSRFNRYVVPLGDGYYAFREDVQPQVSLLVSGSTVELRFEVEPPPGTPSWGDPGAPVRLLIFEDLACPYCARFYNSVYPSVVEPLVREGRLAVYALDFIVHPQVEKQHRLLWCLYRETGDGGLYAELVRKAYQVLGSRGSPMGFEELLNEIGGRLGHQAAERLAKCAESQESKEHLDAVRRLASRLGVRGTPTIAVVGGGYTILVYGLPGADTLKRMIEWVAARAG